MFEQIVPGNTTLPPTSDRRVASSHRGVVCVWTFQYRLAQTTSAEQAPEVSKTARIGCQPSACPRAGSFCMWSFVLEPEGMRLQRMARRWARFIFRLCLTKPWRVQEGKKHAFRARVSQGFTNAFTSPQLGSLPQVWQSELTTTEWTNTRGYLLVEDTGDLFRVHMRSH